MLALIKTYYESLKKEEGVTMIEYGLLAALIAVALIATVILVRNGLVDTFSTAATAMG